MGFLVWSLGLRLCGRGCEIIFFALRSEKKDFPDNNPNSRTNMNEIHHWIKIQRFTKWSKRFLQEQIYESKISFSKQKKELISDHSNKHNRI